MPNNMYDIGLITGPNISVDPDNSDLYIFAFNRSDGQRLRVKVTHGVAQTMWHNLTRMLFPLAAGNVTPRAFTAMMNRDPDDKATVSSVTLNATPEGKVEMVGYNAVGGFTMQFSGNDGEVIWERLEDLLNMMHSGRDHYRHKE